MLPSAHTTLMMVRSLCLVVTRTEWPHFIFAIPTLRYTYIKHAKMPSLSRGFTIGVYTMFDYCVINIFFYKFQLLYL